MIGPSRPMKPAPNRAIRSVSGLVFGVLLLGLVALLAYAPIFSVDFFWHLRLGQLICSERAIPQTDLFSSVHPDRPYVQFQWLWDVLAYAFYRLGQLHGVRVLQVLTLLLSFVALGRFALRTFANRSLAFAFCALALVLFEDRFQARPSASTLGFLALLLPALFGVSRLSARAAPLAMLVLGSLWSNIHGGESLLLLLCLGAQLVGVALEARFGSRPTQDVKHTARLFFAATLGVLLSPTLLPGLLDWLTSIGPQLASGNKEWRPSYTMLENGFTPSFVLIGLGPSLLMLSYLAEQAARLRFHKLANGPFAEWILCAGLCVLSQQAVRNAFLCLVPLAFMLRRVDPARLTARTTLAVAGLGLALLFAAFDDHVIGGYGGLDHARVLIHEDLAPDTYPVELAQFMREAEIEGPVLNDGRWGGYLIWQLWPRCHVFVDTRHDLTAEMWPIFMASHQPETRERAMDDAFARWGVELSVFRGPTFAAVVAPSRWQLLYKAGDQELYQHRAGKHAVANQQRAARWLARHGARDNSSEAASEVGARQWLAAPYQRFQRENAERLLKSKQPDDVLAGLSTTASLQFRAGLYREALQTGEALLALQPGDSKTLYRAALANYALGQREPARLALHQLESRTAELSRAQLARLAALHRELRR